ncbi:MAG: cysteine--tRNA ligase [Lentisphaeria bacterium]|jgi:cysteinyl-tRNA synthetase|nr:cysteine--tRNA ligase [Lentisphaeria bacterium]
MSLRFYNSLGRSVQDFVPLAAGKASLYTCGPTVYNFAHIGNFRAYMFEDLLRRTLELCGYEVKHVMNLTDVDDKTIRDSRAAGLSLDAFTRRFKDAFFEDVATVRIRRAQVYPAATDHVPEMIELIGKLFAAGVAYQAEDGSVYFSIAKWPAYGQLQKIDRDQMRAGVRISHDEYAKESVADFALWKAWSEGDGDVGWDSPWGRGRPGWHIECSAMSAKYLGPQFDVHCGGVDNMFPHHEDEIAQSEAANGCRFVNYWLHCAHLIVNGEKMSKSLGNFYTLRDLLAKGYTGREIRWVLLGTHYRQPLDFSFAALDAARASLQRLAGFRERLAETAAAPAAGAGIAAERAAKARADFQAGLEDDLNISAALAALFDLVRDGNRLLDEGAVAGSAAAAFAEALAFCDQVLDVLDPDAVEGVPADVQRLADERQAARKAKDFARADALRDQLAAAGWVVEDTPKGPRVKRA